MVEENKVINSEKLMQWLFIMAEGMENHLGGPYFEGAAEAYRKTIEVFETGNFDGNIDKNEKNE